MLEILSQQINVERNFF